MGVVPRQHDLELTSGSFHVFSGGRLGAVHRGGNLLVWQFLEDSQRDGHRLTVRKAMNGPENLVGDLPAGQFQPG